MTESQETHKEYKGTEADNKQNRGWLGYRRYLGFPNDFSFRLFLGGSEEQKSRVLDIGAGKAQFAAECREMNNLPVEVVPMDPQYANPAYIADIPAELGLRYGSWNCLPFADGSFDRIVSAGAFPIWSRQEEWKEVLTEMIRVLKPEGKACFKLPPRVNEFKGLLRSIPEVECAYQDGGVTITKQNKETQR